MIHLFQFFKKYAIIPKPDYTPEFRKSFSKWESKIVSRVGFAGHGKLILPEDREIVFDIKRTSCVIIQDVVGHSGSASALRIKREAERAKLPDWRRRSLEASSEALNPEFKCFNNENKAWHFEVFSIEKSTEGFELLLRHQANEFYLGQPGRNNHRLCFLREGEPVRITINGKSDATLTGRMQRAYAEYDYIIEYLGGIDSIEYKALSQVESEKKIPERTAKVIDLRKILY